MSPATAPLEIKADPRDEHGVVRLRVAGEIDMATAGELQKAIGDAAASADIARVVVDLAEVTFCDSSGIAVLVDAQADAAKHRTVIQIANPRSAVQQVLEITCVLDALINPLPP